MERACRLVARPLLVYNQRRVPSAVGQGGTYEIGSTIGIQICGSSLHRALPLPGCACLGSGSLPHHPASQYAHADRLSHAYRRTSQYSHAHTLSVSDQWSAQYRHSDIRAPRNSNPYLYRRALLDPNLDPNNCPADPHTYLNYRTANPHAHPQQSSANIPATDQYA
jgi:hypothetical protein